MASSTSSSALAPTEASVEATATNTRNRTREGQPNNQTSTRQSPRSSTSQRLGRLRATILSAHDLPPSTQPIKVTMEIAGRKLFTGHPSSRHVDRNSYQFFSPQNQQEELVVEAPLRELYSQNVAFGVELVQPSSSSPSSTTVSSENKTNDKNNSATTAALPTKLVSLVPCKTLRIHESQWIVLNLQGVDGAPSAGSGSAASSALTTTTVKAASPPQSTATHSSSATDNYTSSLTVFPTLRVKLTLEGPWRPEIAAIVSLAQSWFRLVDASEDVLSRICTQLQQRLSLLNRPKVNQLAQWFLALGMVPLVGAMLVSFPFLLGILVMALPLLLPLMVLLMGLACGAAVLSFLLYASSRNGRSHLGHIWWSPVYTTLQTTKAGQTIFYDIGPRPSLLSVFQMVLPGNIGSIQENNSKKWSKLMISLSIDVMGSASFLVFGVGEVFDLIWAPIQTLCIMAMFDKSVPSLKYLSFLEEILPFTDIIPSATIGWMYEQVHILLLVQQQQKQQQRQQSMMMEMQNQSSMAAIQGGARQKHDTVVSSAKPTIARDKVA